MKRLKLLSFLFSISLGAAASAADTNVYLSTGTLAGQIAHSPGSMSAAGTVTMKLDPAFVLKIKDIQLSSETITPTADGMLLSMDEVKLRALISQIEGLLLYKK